MPRVKILQIITLSEIGGAQRVVYDIAAGLNPALFDITVACAPGGELVSWLKNLGIKVIEVNELKRNISPVSDFKALLKLYRLIKQEKYDVVHCHSSKAGILGRVAAKLAGVAKIIFTAHGWSVNGHQSALVRTFYNWAERLAGFVSTYVVCVSETDRQKATNLKLVNPEKLSVIYNGTLKVDNFKEGKLSAREQLNIKENDIVIGMVARLAPPKQPSFFLKVAKEVLNKYKKWGLDGDIKFVIVGDGPDYTECKRFIAENNFEKHIFLTGKQKNASELMLAFDIFILFSRWEGLPLTIIEAMHAGIPVVANNVGAVPELMKHNETGFVLSEMDIKAAVDALYSLIINCTARERMGNNGRRQARKYFSVDSMVQKYSYLYQRLQV